FAAVTEAAGAAAADIAVAVSGAVAATGVGAIVGAVILFALGTTLEALQLGQLANEPSQVESLVHGGASQPPTVASLLGDSTGNGLSELYSLFIQATVPSPTTTSACVPYPNNGLSPNQCLNPLEPPAATPNSDPIFAVTPQAQPGQTSSTQYQSSI